MRKDRLCLVCRSAQQTGDEHHSYLTALHIAPVELYASPDTFFTELVQYQTFFLAVKQTRVVISLGANFPFRAISCMND